jgi:thioredoxin reductase (NADPH)
MVQFVHKDENVPHEKIIHYDVVVLGGGPAGLTAAIYSSRYNMKTAVITVNIGGMAMLAPKIENYPGYEGSGIELMKKFHEQAIKFGAKFLHEEIVDIKRCDKDPGYVIETKTGKLVHTKTLILALGTEKKKLEIPGEEKFLGKGVSHCVTCDGNFFKGKGVVVIGGGNAACGAALMLSNIVKKVYLMYRGDDLKCEPISKELIGGKKNIEIVYNSVPLEIRGEKVVREFIYKKNGKKEKLKIDGIFIEVGSIPVTFVAKKLGIITDKDGYVSVNEHMGTNIQGVYAAGDAVKSKLKQVVVAASQGAIAAKSAYDYCCKKE